MNPKKSDDFFQQNPPKETAVALALKLPLKCASHLTRHHAAFVLFADSGRIRATAARVDSMLTEH
jgi:hypothetical protein